MAPCKLSNLVPEPAFLLVSTEKRAITEITALQCMSNDNDNDSGYKVMALPLSHEC